eukprot:TRINITY_DN95491_c0_g1_i1.p1 TRINITY_DN95491_c0_g1~~TRINITY_DN95491_c0_g1_i1.p1  ORF type:complete len:437 (-),score=87.62 TRINITY_DN95491_c0_g1_i1:51-1361(-)
MAGRTRSESPLLDDDRGNADYFRQPGLGSGPERAGVMFNASAARKRAEQDSMLLANRIRLLRAEEAKTRKKIEDTEKKTKEVIEARRRNEERRLAKESFQEQKDLAIQEFRALQQMGRHDQHHKIADKQRRLQEENKRAGDLLRRQREADRHALENFKDVVAAEAYARADQVRATAQAAARSRARSEGAKQEMAKDLVRERMLREEDERRSRLADIERMEKEEAELMSRLERSQARHQAAYLQLEDALRQSGQATSSTGLSPSGSGTLSSSSKSLEAGPRASRGSSSSSQSSLALQNGTGARRRPGDYTPQLADGAAQAPAHGTAAVSSRPPRPRGLPAPSAARPSSAARQAAKAQQANAAYGDAVDQLRQQRSSSAMSCCSTASGAESGRGGAGGSGHSTPSSAAQQIRYTTVDGTQLEIPEEEDLDLAAILNGR